MNKCNWEDGVFKPCTEFDGSFNRGFKEIDGMIYCYCRYCHTNIRKPAKYRAFKAGEMPVAFLDYYYQHNEEPSIYKATVVGMGPLSLIRIDGANWSAEELFWQWQYKKSLSDPEWLRVGVKQIIGEKI